MDALTKEKLLGFIANSSNVAIELQTELCKREAISPDSGGEGELDKCEFLEGWLRNQGITELERYDAPDPRAKGGVRPNLVATIHGGNKVSDKSPISDGNFVSETPRLWIMSHIDVVPPGEASLWKSDPWTLVYDKEKNRITGRGVEDNQQGLTSSVLAALSFIKQGVQPERTVKLLFAADEETGSHFGIHWLVKNHPGLFKKNDLVLIPDSGDSEGSSIEIAEKNLLWMRFVTKGLQAHGSQPDQGNNAHLAGADLILRLYNGLSQKFSARDPLFEPDYSTFQPTKKEANVPNINTIPGEDVFCYDMRILPCYPADEVLKEVDRIKAEVEEHYGVTVSYSVPQRSESVPTSADAALVKLLSKNVQEVYRVATKPVGIGGGTVAACLRNEGIDSVVWSRLENMAHQPNESALLDNILGDAKVMALMMLAD